MDWNETILVSECFRLCISVCLIHFESYNLLISLISYEVCLKSLDVLTSNKPTKKTWFIFFQKNLPTSKKSTNKEWSKLYSPKNVKKPPVISYFSEPRPVIVRLRRATWKSLSFYHRNRLRQWGCQEFLMESERVTTSYNFQHPLIFFWWFLRF